MSNVKIGDIVSCAWLDAHASVKDEFTPDEVQAATSYRFTTYGILVRDDRGSDKKDPLIGIAAEVGEDGRYRGVTYIPIGMVVSVDPVIPEKKSRKKRAIPKAIIDTI